MFRDHGTQMWHTNGNILGIFLQTKFLNGATILNRHFIFCVALFGITFIYLVYNVNTFVLNIVDLYPQTFVPRSGLSYKNMYGAWRNQDSGLGGGHIDIFRWKNIFTTNNTSSCQAPVLSTSFVHSRTTYLSLPPTHPTPPTLEICTNPNNGGSPLPWWPASVIWSNILVNIIDIKLS